MSWETQRQFMVQEQIMAQGVRDPNVLDAMRKVERHLFVPEPFRIHAYDDRPLPIEAGQTISQPYIVAYMIEAVGVDKSSRVLEVGTGSGYQTALLAEMAAEVYSVDNIQLLADSARERLAAVGYNNVHIRWCDGYDGWREEAPFDIIIVSAAAPVIPGVLQEQLKEGGRGIIPVGTTSQDLYRVTKEKNIMKTEKMLPVIFLPLIHGSMAA